MFMNRKILLFGVLACALFLSCYSEPYSPETAKLVRNLNTSNIQGNVRFFLTDNHLTNVKAVNLVVRGVRIKRMGDPEPQAWQAIPLPSQKLIDLLQFRDGLAAVLSDSTLKAGTYQEVRLLISSAEVVTKDDKSETLKIPGGDTSGLKIKFRQEGVKIEEGKNYVFVLDFDLEKSLFTKGNYLADHPDENDGKGNLKQKPENTKRPDENDPIATATWILKPVLKVRYVASVESNGELATITEDNTDQ